MDHGVGAERVSVGGGDDSLSKWASHTFLLSIGHIIQQFISPKLLGLTHYPMSRPIPYSIHLKNVLFFKLGTELCQFLGGGWKVISSNQQLSQPLYAVHNREERFILSEKSSQRKFKGPKKGKKGLFKKIGKSLIVNQPMQLES
jgi:hypothetical protein